MKTRCSNCLDWIRWDRYWGRWVHIATNAHECKWHDTTAVRSVWLPLIELTDEDRKLIRP